MTRREAEGLLAARWRLHRCRCGAPASSVRPGTPALRSETGILLARAEPSRFYCLAHVPGLRQERAA